MVSIGRLSSIGVLLFLNVYVYSSDNITKKNIVEIGSDGSMNVVDTFYPKKDGGDFKNDFDKDCEAVLNYLARKGSIFLGEEKMVNYIGEGYHINYLVTSKDSIDAFMNDSKFDNIPVLRYSKKCSF